MNGVPVTEFHWERLRSAMLKERATAHNLVTDRGNIQRAKWQGYYDACSTLLNEMRRLEREISPGIEDIVTDE